jgi:hypothetical protein
MTETETTFECPQCQADLPAGSKNCFSCGYNFATGQGPAVQAEDEAPPVEVATMAAAAAPAETPTAVTEPVGRRVSAPTADPENVVYAVALSTADTTSSGSASGGSTFVPTAPAAQAATSAVSSPTGIEPSAISVPRLDIVHPRCPHVVLFVDREPRRSRPASLVEPSAREPLVIELTADAHMFGRVIKSFSLDFDQAASGMHGIFQRNEDGGYSLRDESGNGTKLDGTYVEKGTPIPLHDCAVITLGAWTKMVYFHGSAETVDIAETEAESAPAAD